MCCCPTVAVLLLLAALAPHTLLPPSSRFVWHLTATTSQTDAVSTNFVEMCVCGERKKGVVNECCGGSLWQVGSGRRPKQEWVELLWLVCVVSLVGLHTNSFDVVAHSKMMFA
jgi:hypothetical protein